MVNKLTKRRLKLFFTYDFWKVVIVSVLVCALLILGFNFVGRKPTDGQYFKILLDDDVMMGEDIDGLFESLFTKKPTEGGFSYEVLKGDTTIMYNSDENPEEYLLHTVYGDLNYDDIVVLGEKMYKYYVEECHMATCINTYVAQAKEFVVTNAYTNGVFDEQKVRNYFDRTRNKDARFRTKDQKEQGRLDEIERFKGLYFMATALEECFSKNPYLLDVEREIDVYGKKEKGHYGLRLTYLKGKEGKNIANLFNVKNTDSEGKTTYTANGIYIAIGNNKEENGDLYYEMISVLYTLIDSYTNLLK